MRCIYCDQDPASRNPPITYSLEHIWPEALGGTLCNHIFKTRRVCTRCNELAGQWVDGVFLKSWFLQNELSLAAQEFLDPNIPTIAPPIYFGPLSDFPTSDDLVCERWAGLGGAHIYHVHPQDEPEWFGYAGGNPRKRKDVSAGRAYLMLASPEPYWWISDLASFHKIFSRSKRYCVTEIIGLPDHLSAICCPPLDENDLEQKREIEYIRSRKKNELQASPEIRIDYSRRFLVKLALGLGFTLLGDAFLSTNYAKTLRLALWQRDIRKRSKLPVRGTDFHSGPTPHLGDALGIRGAWVILIDSADECLCLSVFTPTARTATIVISDDPMIWQPMLPEEMSVGTVFIVQPQRKLFSGPIALPTYLAHKSGHPLLPLLEDLERSRIRIEDLPKKHQ